MARAEIFAMAAMDEGRVIGRDNGIPWHLPEDLKRLSSMTRGATVLMGRKTYESIPPKFRPLRDRHNVIVTRNPAAIELAPGMEVRDSAEVFLERCRAGHEHPQGGRVWVLGGAEVYRATMRFCDEVYLTLVYGRHEGDAFFPEFESEFELADHEPREGFEYRRYVRRA